MITRFDLDERVREWNLRDSVVEKDYVLGWLLWGIGSDPVLRDAWFFKGGTCLKKCYIETYRFSEDLDFTIVPEGPWEPGDVLPILRSVLERVAEASGLDFSQRDPVVKVRPKGGSGGQVYYIGPRAAPQVASVKIDLSPTEVIARPTVLQKIAHAYPDDLPDPGTVRCYSFEEVFAEKIRAMGERSRPRDLYDIINLFRHEDLLAAPDLIRQTLHEKCASKGVPIPTFETVQSSRFSSELEAEWSNMLGHQLPALPPLQTFLDELPHLFAWLEGTYVPERMASLGHDESELATTLPGEARRWSPPPTVTTWGGTASLESVRFAAINRLCVNLGYNGRKRLIEPYSLRRTKDGNIVLHALRHSSGEHRSYRIDRIQSVEVTTQTFVPRYAIEFSSAGQIHIPPTSRSSSSSMWATGSRRPTAVRRQRAPVRRTGSGMVTIIECPYCGKTFRRTTSNRRLGKHKGPAGIRCPGSGNMGVFKDQRWG